MLYKPTSASHSPPNHTRVSSYQSQTGMAGGAALLRLRAGELLALVALVSSYVPSAVAAALRLAGSLLLNARFVFVLGNAIVLLLFALSRHDLSPSGDEQSSSTTTAQPQAASADDSSAGLVASFAAPATTATTLLTTLRGGAGLHRSARRCRIKKVDGDRPGLSSICAK
jgi:hypothetical protein